MEAKHILQDAAPVSSPTLAERVRRVWALRRALHEAWRQLAVCRTDFDAESQTLREALGRPLPLAIQKIMYLPPAGGAGGDADLAEAIRVAEERDAADSR